jgi:hypothetical protein
MGNRRNNLRWIKKLVEQSNGHALHRLAGRSTPLLGPSRRAVRTGSGVLTKGDERTMVLDHVPPRETGVGERRCRDPDPGRRGDDLSGSDRRLGVLRRRQLPTRLGRPRRARSAVLAGCGSSRGTRKTAVASWIRFAGASEAVVVAVADRAPRWHQAAGTVFGERPGRELQVGDPDRTPGSTTSPVVESRVEGQFRRPLRERARRFRRSSARAWSC